MIRYSLKCSADHSFESWFKSAEAFDSLKGTGLVACPVCGAADVQKAIMTPRVTSVRSRADLPVPVTPERPLRTPASEAEVALGKLRKHVEDNSDYVGLSFAAEARKMHDGDIPLRSIYGEAKADDAKKLLADGVPVAPLPFIPNRKTN